MKKIVFMRHSYALGSAESGAGDDAKRPLSPNGVRLAEGAVPALKNREIEPDLILTSPKLRAAQTAEILSKGFNNTAVEHNVELGGNGHLIELWNQIKNRAESGKTIIVVGHNPDISSLVTSLTNNHISLSPSEFAIITFPDDYSSAELEPINPVTEIFR